VQPAANPRPRRLIVNADDFGQAPGINDGVIRCYERGILTSASLMVRWPEARAAAKYAREARGLSVGLHIDLGEWAYRNGEWVPLYSVTAIDDPGAVRTEVLQQLETFRRLIGSDPTHLDSHQHVHRLTPVDRIVGDIGESLGIPIRQQGDAIRHIGSFYGQGAKGEQLTDRVTVEHLRTIIEALPIGTTEVGCHPGTGRDAPGMYIVEREQEVAVLCDPEVRATIDAEHIQLISFRDLVGRNPNRGTV